MKKVMFSCLMVFMLAATAAFAEGVDVAPGNTTPATNKDVVLKTSYLATKDYVDSGLQAVYTRIKNKNNSTQNDVDELTVYVGAPTVDETPGTGLTKRIEDLESGLSNVGQNIIYTGEGAILVTDDREISIRGLGSSTGTDNKMYVIKNNMASALDVADTWTPATGE